MESIDQEVSKITAFLEKNGFANEEAGVYINDYCSVDTQYDCLAVCNNHGTAIYADDYSLYWLIGVLTYNGFLTKDYNK